MLIDYNYSECITIPRELFNESSGIIILSFVGYLTPTSSFRTATSFSYQKISNDVVRIADDDSYGR